MVGYRWNEEILTKFWSYLQKIMAEKSMYHFIVFDVLGPNATDKYIFKNDEGIHI